MHLTVLDALRIEFQRIIKSPFSVTRLKRKMSVKVAIAVRSIPPLSGVPIGSSNAFFDALWTTCMNEHGGAELAPTSPWADKLGPEGDRQMSDVFVSYRPRIGNASNFWLRHSRLTVCPYGGTSSSAGGTSGAPPLKMSSTPPNVSSLFGANADGSRRELRTR